MKPVLSLLVLSFLATSLSFAQINRPIGINLAGIEDWSEEYVFVDVMNQSREWIAHEYGFGVPWSSGVNIPLRADGYPLEIPYNNGTDPAQAIRTLMYFGDLNDRYPGGMYRLMASGSGQIRLWGAASGTYRCPVDTLVFVDSSRGGVALEIDTSLAADPVHDIHFVMPGFHQNFQSQIFHPSLIDFLEDFQVIRFMDWMKTNGSPVATWSDRNPRDYYTQTLNNGVAYEYILALCNRTYSNPWICIPHQADSQFIVNMATLLRDSLDPCLNIYVEYSNEVWNGIFSQNQYAAAQGQALGYTGQPWERGWKYTARRSADIFQIFEDVFQDTSRLVRVIPSQAANSWVTNYIVSRFHEAQYNPTGVGADAITIAPYFGGGIGDRVGRNGQMAAVTVSDLLDSMEQALPRALGWMDANRTVANNFGLDLMAYEGGQHLVAYHPYHNDTAFVRKMVATNRDPRMDSMYCEYFNYWYDSTRAGMFCAFSSHGNWGRYGSWGLKEYYEDTLSHKYQAMQRCVFAYNAIDPPTALMDQDTMQENASRCFAVLANDLEPNGDTMILSQITRPASAGSATIRGDSICYTPVGGFVGFDTLYYEVCDDGCPALCSEAMLVVEVRQSGNPLGLFGNGLPEQAEAQVRIYPNPSSGTFTLEHECRNPSVQLLTIQGKLIPHRTLYSGERSRVIDAGAYKGIALMYVLERDQRYVRKVVLR